jgi:hypothetical protein
MISWQKQTHIKSFRRFKKQWQMLIEIMSGKKAVTAKEDTDIEVHQVVEAVVLRGGPRIEARNTLAEVERNMAKGMWIGEIVITRHILATTSMSRHMSVPGIQGVMKGTTTIRKGLIRRVLEVKRAGVTLESAIPEEAVTGAHMNAAVMRIDILGMAQKISAMATAAGIPNPSAVMKAMKVTTEAGGTRPATR